MNNEYNVILLDLPTTIPGFVREQDGFSTVVLNARLTRYANQKTYVHEVDHIEDDDMHKELPADEIEAAKHGREK